MSTIEHDSMTRQRLCAELVGQKGRCASCNCIDDECNSKP
jgi:hypothetical protein